MFFPRKQPAGSVRTHVESRWRYTVSFVRFLSRNFMQDRVLISAGSLAFQTLLSLVPLLAVVLAVLSVSPVFDSFRLYVEDFIIQNFVPASGEVVQQYLWQFISKTSSVPTIGGVFLFIIALSLISTVDHTINQIWEVSAPRKFFQGFTLYWTVLTLGPIFIGSSLVATSYVWYRVFTSGPLAEVQARMLLFLPVVNTFLAFFLLYMLVPNRRVKFAHALSGAFLTTLLFELSKRWFSFYVTHVATFEHIYGALSVIPLLFFWIYLIWVVALSGAEFVYCLGAFRPVRAVVREFHPLEGFTAVLDVLERIDSAQRSGRFAEMKSLSMETDGVRGARLLLILDVMQQAGIIHKTADGAFAVNADLHTLTLYDLYSKLPPELSRLDGDAASRTRFDDIVAPIEQNFSQCLQQSLHQPVAALMKTVRHPS
ncbi:MAG: YihY family inner membrane protein [Prosthecochloris sp.]|nr:YihY family inner membrane protein [Prosthecochloris sp.]